MTEKPLCPRLADYLVIVGSRTPNNQTSIQPPELLRRYPTEDHKVSWKLSLYLRSLDFY